MTCGIGSRKRHLQDCDRVIEHDSCVREDCDEKKPEVLSNICLHPECVKKGDYIQCILLEKRAQFRNNNAHVLSIK